MLAKSKKIKEVESNLNGWRLYQFEIQTTFDLGHKIVFGMDITEDVYDSLVKEFKINLAEKMNITNEKHLLSHGISTEEISWKIK